MPLEVIGAGFGRTGTMSTYTALNQLGFPCYHMIEVLENPANSSHLAFWHRVATTASGMQHDWESVFADYTAAVDNPACCVWKELLAAYPQARVLLTVHPGGAEAWYESTIDTIYFTEISWQFKVLKLFKKFARVFGEMCAKLVWQRNHRRTMNDREAAIAHYHAHIEEVKAHVPSGQLLVFDVSEGWEPLCEFLGVEIPEGDFPNVNDRAEVKKFIARMNRGAWVFIGITAVIAAALAWGISWLA
jgi:hypothetical protein